MAAITLELRTVQCACCVLCYFAGRSICYKTDNMGKRLLEIGMFGKGLGEFNEPSGITKEGKNIILVADSRNDRIQVNHWQLILLRLLADLRGWITQ